MVGLTAHLLLLLWPLTLQWLLLRTPALAALNAAAHDSDVAITVSRTITIDLA